MRRRSVRALVILAALLGLVMVWGRHLDLADPEMRLSASPWIGRYGVLPLGGRRWLRLVPAAALGSALVAWWPRCCAQLPQRWLAPTTGLVGVGWAVALQATAGWAMLTRPLTHGADYLAAVDRVSSVPDFLRTFVDRIDSYPIHVQGHPPGQVVMLWLMDRAGAGGPGAAAVLTLGSAAIAIAGVLTVVRWEGGEVSLRRAAVFAGLSPAAIWVATSTDPVFAGLTVAATAAAFQAERSRARAAVTWAAGAGLAGAIALFFTYGAPLFMTPALLPAWRLARARRWLPLATGGAFAVAVVLGVGLAGFNLWDGLAATAHAYRSGVAAHRPYRFFVLANLVVLAVATGPAVVAGAVRGTHGPLAPLLALAAIGVLAADLSGLAKGEVERIWLPFVPWLVLAAAPLATRSRGARGWLAAQLVAAALLQLVLRSPW